MDSIGMKLKAAAAIVMTVLFVVASICSCSGGGKDFVTMMARVPGKSVDFGYWAVGQLSTDEDLEQLYAEFRNSSQAGQLMDVGIALFVVKHAARASDRDGVVTVVDGDLNRKDVERQLQEDGYRETTYREKGIWAPPVGDGPELMTLLKDIVFMGSNDGLRSCIDVAVVEQAYSLYEHQYVRLMVDRLPQGLIVNVHKADSATVEAFADLIASGESYKKERADRLKMTAVYMFQDSDAADNSSAEIKNRLETAGYTDVKTRQDVNFIHVTALISITDFLNNLTFWD